MQPDSGRAFVLPHQQLQIALPAPFPSSAPLSSGALCAPHRCALLVFPSPSIPGASLTELIIFCPEVEADVGVGQWGALQPFQGSITCGNKGAHSTWSRQCTKPTGALLQQLE